MIAEAIAPARTQGSFTDILQTLAGVPASPAVAVASFLLNSDFPVLKPVFAIDDGAIGMRIEPALRLGQVQVERSGLTVGNQQLSYVIHLLARLLCRF
jgi:hypothetical protein